jgi:hypothetical protein
MKDPKKWLAQRMSAATQDWSPGTGHPTRKAAEQALRGDRWPTRVILRSEWEAEQNARRGTR